MGIVEKARVFATAAHAAINHKRKYTGEDYIVHPKAVVDILIDKVSSATHEMLAAAWLHDVVEDTHVSQKLIFEQFGQIIAGYVFGLTNASIPSDGNREVRKGIDKFFLSQQCAEVQAIKVADLIHNTESIVEYDEKFAKIYIVEKSALLKVLDKADPYLRERAFDQTSRIYKKLGLNYE